jgi:hypothetical protein
MSRVPARISVITAAIVQGIGTSGCVGECGGLNAPKMPLFHTCRKIFLSDIYSKDGLP